MTTATAPLILVVDDDPDTCALVSTLLGREGYTTCRAMSGPEALAVVEREPVTLALLDVVMPEMDGFAVIDALRRSDRGRHLPVILLTGRNDLDTRQEGMLRGVSEFLTKPIDKNELYARVRAQLHIVELTRQLEAVEQNLKQAPGARGDRTNS
jgi:CheY-like chemotaxis protein